MRTGADNRVDKAGVAVSKLFAAYRASWETDQHRELRKHAAEFLLKEATPNRGYVLPWYATARTM